MSGEDVKKILAGNGITLRILAERLGTTPQNVSNLLSKEDIRTGLLEDISKVTGIPLEEANRKVIDYVKGTVPHLTAQDG